MASFQQPDRETKKVQSQPFIHTFTQGREWILSLMARANEIAQRADASAMIEGMLDLMMEVARAESLNFFQLDALTDELVMTHMRGDADSQYLVGLRLNRQQGLPGMAFGDSRVVVVGDLPAEPDWLRVVDPESAARKRNVINLPLGGQDQALGVIQIYNFEQADLALLKVLCDRLSVEIIRRNEVDSTRRSNQRLLTLVDMLGDVAGTLDRNRLLQLVTESASRLVGGERSSVFLVDPKTRDMLYQVAYQAPVEDSSQKAGGSVAAREPQAQPARFRPGEFSFFNRSAITVPLRSDAPHSNPEDDAHIMGGLMVLNKQNQAFLEEDAQLMHILANQASTFLQVAEMYESAGELFMGVIRALASAIDAKDPYTKGHSQSVSEYSVLIARELGLDEIAINDIRIGSLFHDIGKIGIPDAILLKNGRLTDEEMALIRLHPRTGVNILSQVKLLEPMTPAILEHHERLDGSGYPAKLKGAQISWMGRIVAVADVYDAMTTNRPYRAGLSTAEVLNYLHDNVGILFDAECVLALERALAHPLTGESAFPAM